MFFVKFFFVLYTGTKISASRRRDIVSQKLLIVALFLLLSPFQNSGLACSHGDFVYPLPFVPFTRWGFIG